MALSLSNPAKVQKGDHVKTVGCRRWLRVCRHFGRRRMVAVLGGSEPGGPCLLTCPITGSGGLLCGCNFAPLLLRTATYTVNPSPRLGSCCCCTKVLRLLLLYYLTHYFQNKTQKAATKYLSQLDKHTYTYL